MMRSSVPQPPPTLPEALSIEHRHPYPQALRRHLRRLVTSIGVANDAYAWIVEEHALQAGRSVFGAVGEYLGSGVDGTADAEPPP
jgi:hypothetical protein